MPFQMIDDEQIYFSYSDGQSEQNLILVHGAGGDHMHWPDAVRHLSGLNVYGLDLPGHGNSEGHGRKSVDEYADVIDAFVRARDLSQVTLCGHSMGGAVTQTLALRRPDWLSRIILVGTGSRLRVAPAILDGLRNDFHETIELICQWAYGPDAPEPLVRAGREALLRMDSEVTHGDYSACNLFDVTARLGEIPLPTLVISGSADKLTPQKYGEHLSTHIPGAEMAVIENGGHMMALEKPEQFVKILISFFKKGAR